MSAVLGTAVSGVASILGMGEMILSTLLGADGVMAPIMTFSVFFIGIMVLNICIAFWFPVFPKKSGGNTYTQANPSEIYKGFLFAMTGLKIALNFASLLFVYAPLVFTIFRSLRSGDMFSAYYAAFYLLLLQVFLIFIGWLSLAFVKYPYYERDQTANVATPFGDFEGFQYCAKSTNRDAAVGDYLASTCVRTTLQTWRDLIFSSTYDYTSSLSLYSSNGASDYALPALLIAGAFAAL